MSELRAALAAPLSRVLGGVAEIVECKPITGGTGGRAFRVLTTTHELVAKFSGASLPLDQEFDILERVAARGLGPRPVGFDVESGLILTEYCVGERSWSPADTRALGNIQRIAAVLRGLHGLRPPLRAFEPLAFVTAYIGEPGSLAAADRALFDELSVTLGSLPVSAEAPVLCHNDLVAANVLDDGRLQLIDFEYAVLAAPIVDLASLAAMNEFSAREQAALIEAYYAGQTRPPLARTFAKVMRIHELIAHFWRRAQPASRRAAREPGRN